MLNDILLEIRRRCLSRLKEQSNARLDMELDWFRDNGGFRALLLISDYVRHLKSTGIFIGSGHGVECCSLVCYGLGITNVNSQIWSLPFEMFSRDYSENYSLCIQTSSGGIGELEHLRKLSGYPEGVVVCDGGTAQVQFLDDLFHCCLFRVIESSELDLLKAFQYCRPESVLSVSLDQKLLDIIREDGFAGFSELNTEKAHELVRRFSPECFSDLCIVFSALSPSVGNRFERILAIRETGDIPARENATVDSILSETYGVLLYREQKIALERFHISCYDVVDAVSLPSKADAVSCVSDAVRATAFKYLFAEMYEKSVFL